MINFNKFNVNILSFFISSIIFLILITIINYPKISNNNNLNKEIDKLNKLSLIDLKTKDLIEEEEDKAKLKELNEDIKAIKNRQKFNKTPDEIYDEIDMYFLNSKENTSSEEAKNEVKPEEKLEEEEPEKLETTMDISPKPERLKVIDVLPVETITNTGGN